MRLYSTDIKDGFVSSITQKYRHAQQYNELKKKGTQPKKLANHCFIHHYCLQLNPLRLFLYLISQNKTDHDLDECHPRRPCNSPGSQFRDLMAGFPPSKSTVNQGPGLSRLRCCRRIRCHFQHQMQNRAPAELWPPQLPGGESLFWIMTFCPSKFILLLL